MKVNKYRILPSCHYEKEAIPNISNCGEPNAVTREITIGTGESCTTSKSSQRVYIFQFKIKISQNQTKLQAVRPKQ